MRPLLTPLALLTALALAACGNDAIVVPTGPLPLPGPAPMTGPDFAANARSLNSQPVTIGVCSLDPAVDTLGLITCRVRDPAGNDVANPRAAGPLDIYFVARELDEAGKTYIDKNCRLNYCLVAVTGTLEISDGPGLLVIKNPVFGVSR